MSDKTPLVKADPSPSPTRCAAVVASLKLSEAAEIRPVKRARTTKN